MFQIIFKGYVELEEFEEFSKDFQELLKKYNTVFHGQTTLNILPKDVDYQKIDDGGNSDVQN
jgi:hypothetical protein